MARELWGTFSVRDHRAPNAFVREVLLFDRLVLPVPETSEERARWEHPDPADSEETWDPTRLEVLRGILGSQHVAAEPAPGGGWLSRLIPGRRHRPAGGAPASLIWDSPWSQERWSTERSRVEMAETITAFDAFSTTRSILAMGEDLPGVVEVVAAFPSRAACRAELAPESKRPADVTAAQALLMFATPLLVPEGNEGSDFGPLREAAELARESQFQIQRQAYYDWMRDFVAPLRQRPNQTLDEIRVDRASLDLAEEKLHGLVSAQRALLGTDERKHRWSRTEYALTVLSVAAASGLALTAPLAAVGAAAPLVGLGGWLAGERATPDPPEPRPLGGASMFVSAQQRLGWVD